MNLVPKYHFQSCFLIIGVRLKKPYLLTPVAKVVAPGYHGFIESRPSALCVVISCGLPTHCPVVDAQKRSEHGNKTNGVSGPSLCRCRHRRTLRVGC